MTAKKPEDLYALPLDQFTAARNTLAKETGDKAIAKLRKPSTAAWALNQAARRHKGAVARFLHAAEAVRAGGGRAAMTDLRGTEADVRRAALAATTDTQLSAINELLAAAAADPEVADVLRQGTLTGDEEAGSTGLVAPTGGRGASSRRAPSATAQPKPKRDELAEARERKRREEARRKADEAAADARELAHEADRLEREAANAEDKAARARQHAQSARAKADAAQRKADELHEAARA